jgi:hypothetical protein
VKDQNLAKIYVIVNTSVDPFTVENAGKDAGGENEGESRDVIEKKWWKDVYFLFSRDVVEKTRVISCLSRC